MELDELKRELKALRPAGVSNVVHIRAVKGKRIESVACEIFVDPDAPMPASLQKLIQEVGLASETP